MTRTKGIEIWRCEVCGHFTQHPGQCWAHLHEEDRPFTVERQPYLAFPDNRAMRKEETT